MPEKLGEVSFLVSCAPAVQQQFDRGVALLHSFAYSAAEANFLEIARTDPDCAMAHWGVARAHVLGLARAGKPNAATAELARLNELLPQVRSAGDDYWANQMEIQSEEGKAWVAHARGQHEQAVSLLRSVAEKEDALEKRPVTPGPIVPAREQLGDLLLELNRPREALREFESSLRPFPSAPRRFVRRRSRRRVIR